MAIEDESTGILNILSMKSMRSIRYLVTMQGRNEHKMPNDKEVYTFSKHGWDSTLVKHPIDHSLDMTKYSEDTGKVFCEI